MCNRAFAPFASLLALLTTTACAPEQEEPAQLILGSWFPAFPLPSPDAPKIPGFTWEVSYCLLAHYGSDSIVDYSGKFTISYERENDPQEGFSFDYRLSGLARWSLNDDLLDVRGLRLDITSQGGGLWKGDYLYFLDQLQGAKETSARIRRMPGGRSTEINVDVLAPDPGPLRTQAETVQDRLWPILDQFASTEAKARWQVRIDHIGRESFRGRAAIDTTERKISAERYPDGSAPCGSR